MITIDPEFKALIPSLSAEEYDGLKTSLINEGCRDPLVVWGEFLLDGHNRLEICQLNNIPFNTIGKQFTNKDDAKIWIIQNQLSRRNFSMPVRIDLGELLRPLLEARAKKNQACGQGGILLCQKSDKASSIDTNKEIAKIVGCSKDTVAKKKKIREKASPEINQKVNAGDMSINEAYKEIKKAEKDQKKQEAIEALNIEITKPNGLYHVLVVDPPWPYEKRADDASHRGRCLYPDISIEKLMALEIPAEEDSILWLWTTNAFMHEAYHLIEEWGFSPKTILTWVKDRMGTGDWLRGKTEHCIFAVKGNPVIDLTNQTTVLNAPTRQHSRKPDEFYKMIEELCPGRKIDYFSREKREGWEQWGSESDKF
jgi:N6-adenosine-specific RNA methylase IME4